MTDFVFYGFLYSGFLICLILSIFLVKKLFSQRLTIRFHYYIWLALPVSAIALFFPDSGTYGQAHIAQTASSAGSASGSPLWGSAAGTLQDFAVNSRSGFGETLCIVLSAIWLAGILIMLTRLGIALRHTAGLCRRAASLEAEQQTFAVCKSAADLLNLRQPYPVAISAEIQSPVTVRVLRPQVLLPVSCVHGQEKDLRYILLHEFTHCKYRDPLFNLLMQLFLCVNWMNPAVWYVMRQMEADREACCDHLVLEALCGRERIEYGHVLLSWAGRGEAFAAVGMDSGRTMLHRRILRIASYKPDSSLRQKGSALLLLAAMLLTFVLAPSVHGLSVSRFQPSEDLNISYENLESYFDGQEGSFVLYSQNQDHYTIYNKSASTARVSPNSTYKIYSALAALEAGVIESSNSSRQWDGTKYAFSQWNRRQTLRSAMQNSVNWYFQGLDQQMGQDALQDFYHKIGYGNENLNGGISSYWMESSLKISPLEQTMLLTDFYENQWHLKESSVSAVKDALLISQNKGVRLSGKTGTGMKDGREMSGWFIGYVESPQGLFVFALNLQGESGASGSRAAQIALRILEDRQIL